MEQEQIKMKPLHNLQMTLLDRQSGIQHQTYLEVFSNDELSLALAVSGAAAKLFKTYKGENTMDQEIKQQDDTTFKKAADQKQDLTHHKTEETDNLVKAERPADDFMKQNDMDKETHGKKE